MSPPSPARRAGRAPRAQARVPERALVTGGAGFVGSHLVERLVASGAQVTVMDDLSSGLRANLEAVRDRIRFVPADCSDAAMLDRLLPGIDRVWHLAANPDVRAGASDPEAHYKSNVKATWALLEGMRRNDVRRIAFTSTSTVYGRAAKRPTPENYGPLLPASVYGGAKLAAEALVASHCHTFGMEGLLFRFANVVGPRAAHGVVLDFTRKLRTDPRRLEVLGDGTQTKSYVSVEDTVAGMLAAVRKLSPPGTPAPAPGMGTCQAFNIASGDAIDVDAVARIVAKAVKARPELIHMGGAPDGGGWVGDVKKMSLDARRLRRLGWRPRHASAQAVRRAAAWAAQAIPPRDEDVPVSP